MFLPHVEVKDYLLWMTLRFSVEDRNSYELSRSSSLVVAFTVEILGLSCSLDLRVPHQVMIRDEATQLMTS
ncbi:hypothetical protein CVE32_03415 [Pseudomonas syringae pv. actinidiae]|nr:hypothetical protein [Pseudomonas syringae pv. actinidiae]